LRGIDVKYLNTKEKYFTSWHWNLPIRNRANTTKHQTWNLDKWCSQFSSWYMLPTLAFLFF
jgi:hypothetical protein